MNCPLINQIYIYGDSEKSELVGIIVPDETNCIHFLKDKGVYYDGMSHVLNNDYLKIGILRAMNEEIAEKYGVHYVFND